MNAISRLFWKELRAQSSVWISLLFGLILIDLIFVTQSGPTAGSLNELLLGTAFVVSACLAAASAAILFAGETEEGHADWLRALPMTTQELIIGKLGFGILATSSFVVVAMLISFAFSHVTTGQSQYIPLLSSTMCVAGCFVWGVFYSLFFRRVLPVLMAAALTTIVVMGLFDGMVREQRGNSALQDVLHATLLVVISIVDLCLIGVWHRGELRRPRTVAPPRPGSSISWPTFALPLKWCVTTGPVEVRRWTVLLWKELSSALPFLIGCLAIALTLMTLLMRPVAQVLNVHILNVLILPAVVVMCGLMSFRDEQRHSQIDFLTHRGVSGARVWSIKTAVWLTSAAAVTAICLGWEWWNAYALESRAVLIRFGDRQGRPLWTGELLSMTFPVWQEINSMLQKVATHQKSPIDNSIRVNAQLSELRWGMLSLAGVLFLGLFAIGQVASFWIRRTILAVATAFIGAVLFLTWAMSAVRSDVPLAGAVWPIVIALLLSVWATRRMWTEQLTGWRTRVRQAAWVVVPIVGCTTYALAARAWQVPEVDPGFDWRNTEATLNSPDAQWTKQWKEAMTGNAVQSLAEMAGPQLRLDPLLFGGITTGAYASSLSRALELLENSVRPRSNLRQQLSQFKTAMRGVRYLRTQTSSWTDLSLCFQAERRLLARVRAWAAASHQTDELLTESLVWLAESSSSGDSPAGIRQDVLNVTHDMLQRRYVVLRSLYTGEGRLGEALWKEMAQSPYGALPALFRSAAGKGERTRLLRLINWVTASELRMPLATLPELEKEWNRDPTRVLQQIQYRRFASTTPWLPAEMDPAQHDFEDFDKPISMPQLIVLMVQQSRNISTAVVALQLHRLKHGEFPESLDELKDLAVAIPRDPLSGDAFHFRRNDSVGQFPPDQPTLWTSPTATTNSADRDKFIYGEWFDRTQLVKDRVLVMPRDQDIASWNPDWPERPVSPPLPNHDEGEGAGSAGSFGLPGLSL